MTAPVIVTVMVVTRVMNSDGNLRGDLLGREIAHGEEHHRASASSENWLKPSTPGRTMIRTPMKPAVIASQRRQPTGSRKSARPRA